jgi:hypothetical protein
MRFVSFGSIDKQTAFKRMNETDIYVDSEMLKSLNILLDQDKVYELKGRKFKFTGLVIYNNDPENKSKRYGISWVKE